MLSFGWYLEIQMDLTPALGIYFCHCHSCRIRHCATDYIQNYLWYFKLEKQAQKILPEE